MIAAWVKYIVILLSPNEDSGYFNIVFDNKRENPYRHIKQQRGNKISKIQEENNICFISIL